MRRALLFGAKGQDGQLLTSLLVKKNYVVLGVSRTTVDCTDGSYWQPTDILNFQSVRELIQRFLPDEIYYLAAFHHPSQNKELLSPEGLWSSSLAINVSGLINVLETVRLYHLIAKVFYASSCLVYGNTITTPQTEETPYAPDEIYAITKVAGMQACHYYRAQHSLFVASGILYNHESALRAKKFVSQKIIQGALSIKRGETKHLDLGSLSAEIDWGYAPDFVEAMYLILQLDQAEDFIIATGTSHTVRDFVTNVFSVLGLDWAECIRENDNIIQRRRGKLVGDFSKLKNKTGRIPSVSFNQMIVNMINGEI